MASADGPPLEMRPDAALQSTGHQAPPRYSWARHFAPNGNLRPFRLLGQDLVSLRSRWLSDWTVFNQQVVASSVYIFFTNILPGITFASDLYVKTGRSWGTVEIVMSTGLCGIMFALYVLLENLPFSLAES